MPKSQAFQHASFSTAGPRRTLFSADFVSQHRLQTTPSSGSVRLGNGSDGQITCKCTLSLSMHSYHVKVMMYVVELSPAMEVVLGEPWLRQSSFHLESSPAALSCVHVWKGKRRFALRPNVVQDKPEQVLLSAMQCKKAMRKSRGWSLSMSSMLRVMMVLRCRESILVA